MSRRRELELHRDSLVEIREIMNSMKTLAYLETHKLQDTLPAQNTMVDDIESAAADFLAFHADILPDSLETQQVILVFGSERGFCGDFNQALAHQLHDVVGKRINPATIIAIGHKLHTLLQDTGDSVHLIAGANTVDETFSVLNEIVEVLGNLQATGVALSLQVLCHGHEDSITTQELLPPFRHLRGLPTILTEPPLLNVTPEQFLSELTDAYLFAALQQILNRSLMAENHRRVQHMDGAVRHLEQMSTEILHQCNALRQEEITEEIEVILLNAANLSGTR